MNNFVYLAFILCMFPICIVQTTDAEHFWFGKRTCMEENKSSGVISNTMNGQYEPVSECWTIEVPQDSFVRINFKSISLTGDSCSDMYIKVDVPETSETYTYCSQENLKPLTELSDVRITQYHSGRNRNRHSAFELTYSIENLICAQKNHFRCSSTSCVHRHQQCDGKKDCENGIDEDGCEKLICYREDHFRCSPTSCIHQHQVCDGEKDCENGSDEAECGNGMVGIRGVTASRENVITWLKGQRSTYFGWGKNTHRAITALYLAEAVDFTRENLDEELMIKQLELQTAVALLRNFTDPVPVSELSMFVNALTVMCHDPRTFYGYNLLQILRDRVSETEPPSPSAYLTLCNSNWTFSESDTKRLLRPLENHSKYPFISDVQAVAVMALTCMKNKTHYFRSHTFPTNLYNRTIETFIAGQRSDGSFGNVYTTALVTQALIASGQENNEEWNVTATAQYLMQKLNSSSIDFLSAYLTLPIFSGRSLVDITNVDCSNITRTQGENNEISDVMNRLGEKMHVQYSLYVGDQKDVVHTILLRMPENSSAYDVMRVAQVADPKYKFLHLDVSGQMYVYEIAGITNDPEVGKFWLLYTGNRNENGTVMHHIESPDEFILEDNEHLIMWYKTADI